MRLPRYFVEGQPQHIIQRGNNRQEIFEHKRDYEFYMQCLIEAAEKNSCIIHAYVFMTNHVHLLITPKTKESLPKTMQSIGRRYVQYYNYTHDRTGTLWEGRYKATLIDSEQYLMTCMRYIELNPVRAGMVEHPEDYPWSSYNANAYGKENVLLEGHPLYKRLGLNRTSRQKAYRALFDSYLPEKDLNDIRDATNKAWILGNKYFCSSMEGLSGRRATPQNVGRPRKLG